MLTLGVIADTHIPDRAREIPQAVFDIFRQANITAILHAGDICSPRVLKELGELAPVIAVRGNRDWFVPGLPLHTKLQYEDVSIGLTHGHGNWWGYILDKLYFVINGPRQFSYVENKVQRIFPEVDVVIFGHNHAPVNRRENGRLLFNPGSPNCPNIFLQNTPFTIGLLHIDGNSVQGEIVEISR
jgi:putative phosphoesterase